MATTNFAELTGSTKGLWSKSFWDAAKGSALEVQWMKTMQLSDKAYDNGEPMDVIVALLNPHVDHEQLKVGNLPLDNLVPGLDFQQVHLARRGTTLSNTHSLEWHIDIDEVRVGGIALLEPDGSVLFYDQFPASRTLVDQDIFRFEKNAINITI